MDMKTARRLDIQRLHCSLGVLAGGCTVGPKYTKPEVAMPGMFTGDGRRGDDPAGRDGCVVEVVWRPRAGAADGEGAGGEPGSADRAVAGARERGHATSDQRGPAAERRCERVLPAAADEREQWDLIRAIRAIGGALGPGRRRDTDLFQAGLMRAGSWMCSGGVKRSVEAADADVAASVEDRRDVTVTLLAEVGRNYVELGLSGSCRSARANLAAQRETAELIRVRVRAGLQQNAELDLKCAEAQASTTAAEIPSLEAAARRAAHRLAVCRGVIRRRCSMS